MILPCFVNVFGTIAWTSFAERYLYLPSAFILLSTVLFIGKNAENMPSLPVKKDVVIILLLMVMFGVTFHRSWVWKDSLRLLQDTVEKNPNYYYVRGQYADELAIRGDIKNARIQYTIASQYNKNKKRLKDKDAKGLIALQHWEMPELGLADLLNREKRIPEAIAAYEKIIRNSDDSEQALNNVIILYDGLLDNDKNRPDFGRIRRILSTYSDKYFKKSGDANIYFWLGKKFLLRGDKREALSYFRKADRGFKSGNEQKRLSEKFITHLESK